MVRVIFLATLGCLLAAIGVSRAGAAEPGKLNEALARYVEKRTAEFDQISAERKQQLKKLALYVRTQLSSGQPANLTFICTHNSRRSHMAQLWASVGATYYGIDKVSTFSGGTEATAFNPRAVKALERAGFRIEKAGDGKNPRYNVFLSPDGKPLVCFSKVYDSEPNPKADYCAVMTCSQADKNCPVVKGASLRLPITYEDPKAADDTPGEAAKYDERCAQIARELLYAFSLVKG
jgi:protein-tyrosine-phosphatase